ncbi:MAG: hypothetical protein IT308_10325 [Anaerolineaceae bacterium]|nr:hypothetical protein [Anaerolineaceae bacterium]
MTKQKLSFIIMILYLALVFNLERIGLAGGTVLKIHPVLYIFLVLASVGTLLIPSLNRLSVYFYSIFWGALYLFARAFIFADIPILGGDSTLVVIAELSLLILGVFLSCKVAAQQKEYENFVEKVSMPAASNPILDGSNAEDQIKVEFIRSRRHNRPLALLVVEPSSGSFNAELRRSVQELQKKMTQRFLVATLAQLISTEARRTDLVISKNDHGRFVILCPETSSEGSIRLAERIQMVAMEQLGISMVFGIASFPDEALTYEDLLNKAEFQMQHFVALPLSTRSITVGKSSRTNES